MKNRLLCRSRYVLGLLVFLFSLSFSLGVVYAQDFNSQRRMNGRFAEKAAIFLKNHPRLRAAIKAHKIHQARLMETFGVVATGIGVADDEPVVKVFTSRAGIAGIPGSLDGFKVQVKVAGRFYALADPPPPDPTARWPRPVPIGVSTGHPNITAGTIGARVTDASGKVYALSNNHVYADTNNGIKGIDPVLQPGAFDGGTASADAIGTLIDYEPIKFCEIFWFWLFCNETNTMDAAIALTTTGELGHATPSDGYGSPSSVIHPAFGDPAVMGDEDVGQLLGLGVQKYGRTTSLTSGTVDTINATVDVCYDDLCYDVARFTDQIIITPGTFSGGGDSGSLIVDQVSNRPVGLLFAGSDTDTIANRIDLVLYRFEVSVDSGEAPVLESISVEPATATVEVGRDQPFTATGIYDDGSESDITSDVTWDSSNSAVATINTSGVATGLDVGTTLITASLDEITSAAAELQVIAPPPPANLVSIELIPATAEIVEGETQQFTAMGTYDDESTEDLTLSVTWESSNPGVATIDASGVATGVSAGIAGISATASQDGITSDEALLTVTEPPVPTSGPHLQTGTVWATSAGWTKVNLQNDHDYGNKMVAVCALNYDDDPYGLAKMPLVPHVRNAAGKSFEVMLSQAVFYTFEVSEALVHWMVVEEGVYNVAEHGVKMEAFKFNSSVTDNSRSWMAQNRDYANDYTNPVVVGQVMSYDSGFWSVFWSRGSSRSRPPSNTALWVGKHVGEEFYGRNDETIGYIVIEAGEGTMGSTKYYAALGSDAIRGVGNSPPYTYSLNGLSFTPSTAIVSQAAMDGANGGWAILYGNNPITGSGGNCQLRLAIEEDWFWDSERRHTSEQVAYILIE